MSDIVVFYDEIDLAPGRFRMKTGGGAAGHNGIRSIIASSVGEGFRRARMGVGHPGQKELVHHYVLSDFYKAEAEWLQKLLDACARAASFVRQGRRREIPGRSDAPGAGGKGKSAPEAWRGRKLSAVRNDRGRNRRQHRQSRRLHRPASPLPWPCPHRATYNTQPPPPSPRAR
jgi:hypothetical protein